MLKGKIVWITGASSGIGEQLAYACAENGAKLILSSRNRKKLDQVKAQLPSGRESAFVLSMDLEAHGEIPGRVFEVLKRFGHIDILIHNAAVALRDFALSTLLSTDKRIMAINYFGPVCLTKHVLPHMLERGSGQIAVMSSLSGKYGVPRTSSYAASKHALHGFFESLRSEIAGKGVDITILVPGIIRTRITEHALNGDGSLTGHMEETFRKAYPAEKAAKKVISAIARHKEEVFIGGAERITLPMYRISPWLLRRFIRNHPIRFVRNLKRKLSLKPKPSI
jgi:short-subunit dehydrogenase